MTAPLWWNTPDKMGSSDKNSIAAYLPVTTYDYITIIQKDSVIWWHLLMKNLDKTVSMPAIREKHFEKFAVEWSKDITCYTAVQFDLQFNNALVSVPTPYSPKCHLWPALHTISQTDASEPLRLVVWPLSWFPVQIWSSSVELALSQQIWYTAFVVRSTRMCISLHVP